MPSWKRCVICGKYYKNLSVDHIPPHSCGNKGRIRYNLLYLRTLTKNGRVSENGLKFETICERCNNELGAKYDKSFASFYNAILSSAKNGDPSAIWKGNPVLLAKSVFGHILAAKNVSDLCPEPKKDQASGKTVKDFLNYENSQKRHIFCNDDLDKEMRNYVRSNIFPKSVHLYAFYYPYENVIVCIQHCLPVPYPKESDSSVPEDCFMSGLYFYPVAFIATTSAFPQGTEILSLCQSNRTEISISFTSWTYEKIGKPKPFAWPCQTENPVLKNQTILFGDKCLSYSTIAIKENVRMKTFFSKSPKLANPKIR